MRIDELLKVANAEQQSLLKERVNGLAKNGANISMDTYIDFFKALLEHMQTDLSNADDSVLADFETIISAFASHIINNTHSNANLTVSHKIALNLLSKAIMVVKKHVKKEQILEYTRIFLEWKKSYLNPNQHFLALKTAPAPEAHKPSNIANTIQEEKNIMRKQNDNPENAPLSPEEVKAYLTEAANEFYKQHQETPEIQRNKDGDFDFYNTFYWAAITKPGEKFDDEKKRFMPKFVIIIRPPQNIYAHGEQLFQHLKKSS